jgi:hypothetical protein
MAHKFNKSIRDGVYLSGYDIGKGSIKSKKITLPPVKQIADNFIGGIFHNFVGEKVLKMAGDKMLPGNQELVDIVGKIGISIPVGITVSQMITGSGMSYRDIFMKSLIAIGLETALER